MAKEKFFPSDTASPPVEDDQVVTAAPTQTPAGLGSGANLYPAGPPNNWPAGLPRVWNRHTGEEVTDPKEAIKIFDQYRRAASQTQETYVFADPSGFDFLTKVDAQGRRLEDVHPPPPPAAVIPR